MIYTKITLINGLFEIKCFDRVGKDVTKELQVNCEVYLKKGEEYLLADVVETSSKEVSTSIVKEDFIYATVFLNEVLYKSYIKVPVINNKTSVTYSFVYRIKNTLPEQSNLLLNRVNYFMPKWSVAYKNPVTNYSKVTYPFFSNIEKLFYKTDDALKKALKNKKTFKEIIRNTPVKDIGKVETEEGVEMRYSYNSTNSPYTRALFTQVSSPILEDFTESINLQSTPSKLFIKSPKGSVVTVRGIIKENVFVTETLTYTADTIQETKFHYKQVIGVFSTNTDTVYKTFLDTSSEHISENFYELPTFSNSSKKLQFPTVTLVTPTTLSVQTKVEKAYDEETYFLLENACKCAYVDNVGNILVLTENGILQGGVLKYNLEVNMPLHASNNDNIFVSVESQDVEKNEVTFIVDCKSLYEDFEKTTATIQVKTESSLGYFDSISKTFTEDVSHCTVSKHNKLRLRFNYAENDFISLVVNIDNKSFQASLRNDRISLTTLGEKSFQSLLKYNDDLLVQDFEGNFLRLDLRKDYYEISPMGYLTVDQQNTKVRTLKGRLLNG